MLAKRLGGGGEELEAMLSARGREVTRLEGLLESRREQGEQELRGARHQVRTCSCPHLSCPGCPGPGRGSPGQAGDSSATAGDARRGAGDTGGYRPWRTRGGRTRY